MNKFINLFFNPQNEESHNSDLFNLFWVNSPSACGVGSLLTGDRELEYLGRYEENAYLMRMMKVVGHKQTKLYELNGYDH